MKRRSDSGAAAVEFALVATLLISMFLMIFEGGRMWYVQANLAAAARDGAREMAIKNDQNAAKTRFESVFSPIGTSPSDVLTLKVTPATGSCDSGGAAEFEATYVTSTLTGFFDPLIGGSVTITGVGEMRCGG